MPRTRINVARVAGFDTSTVVSLCPVDALAHASAIKLAFFTPMALANALVDAALSPMAATEKAETCDTSGVRERRRRYPLTPLRCLSTRSSDAHGADTRARDAHARRVLRAAVDARLSMRRCVAN
jgi:hypothetical protein